MRESIWGITVGLWALSGHYGNFIAPRSISAFLLDLFVLSFADSPGDDWET